MELKNAQLGLIQSISMLEISMEEDRYEIIKDMKELSSLENIDNVSIEGGVIKKYTKKFLKFLEDVILKFQLFIKKVLDRINSIAYSDEDTKKFNDRMSSIKNNVELRERLGKSPAIVVAGNFIPVMNIIKAPLLMKDQPFGDTGIEKISSNIINVLKSFGIVADLDSDNLYAVVGLTNTTITLACVQKDNKRYNVSVDCTGIKEKKLFDNINNNTKLLTGDGIRLYLDQLNKQIDNFMSGYKKVDYSEMTDKEEAFARKIAGFCISNLTKIGNYLITYNRSIKSLYRETGEEKIENIKKGK